MPPCSGVWLGACWWHVWRCCNARLHWCGPAQRCHCLQRTHPAGPEGFGEARAVLRRAALDRGARSSPEGIWPAHASHMHACITLLALLAADAEGCCGHTGRLRGRCTAASALELVSKGHVTAPVNAAIGAYTPTSLDTPASMWPQCQWLAWPPPQAPSEPWLRHGRAPGRISDTAVRQFI